MEYTKVAVRIEPNQEWICDVLMAQLGEMGFESFAETNDGFDAFIPSGQFKQVDLNSLELPVDDVKLSFATEVIADQNWNKVWEENYFKPIVIGKECQVRSPFHEKAEDVTYDILIEPKMAFGTGHHSTTSLMLQHILETGVKQQQVLDMGCGTGILGMLCAMKGAQHVIGIDIDEWAYNNAIENLELNEVKNMTIQMGGAELLGSQEFDTIFANINRNILLSDIKHYINVLKAGGKLFLSGFYTEDLEAITNECKQNGLQYLSHKMDNNWVAAAYTKPVK